MKKRSRFLSLVLAGALLLALGVPVIPVAHAAGAVINLLDDPSKFTPNSKVNTTWDGTTLSVESLVIEMGGMLGWSGPTRTYSPAITINTNETRYLFLDVEGDTRYTTHAWNIYLNLNNTAGCGLAALFSGPAGSIYRQFVHNSEVRWNVQAKIDLQDDATLVAMGLPAGTTSFTIGSFNPIAVCEQYTAVKFKHVYFANEQLAEDTTVYQDRSAFYEVAVGAPTGVPHTTVADKPDYYLNIDNNAIVGDTLDFTYNTKETGALQVKVDDTTVLTGTAVAEKAKVELTATTNGWKNGIYVNGKTADHLNGNLLIAPANDTPTATSIALTKDLVEGENELIFAPGTSSATWLPGVTVYNSFTNNHNDPVIKDVKLVMPNGNIITPKATAGLNKYFAEAADSAVIKDPVAENYNSTSSYQFGDMYNDNNNIANRPVLIGLLFDLTASDLTVISKSMDFSLDTTTLSDGAHTLDLYFDGTKQATYTIIVDNSGLRESQRPSVSVDTLTLDNSTVSMTATVNSPLGNNVDIDLLVGAPLSFIGAYKTDASSSVAMTASEVQRISDLNGNGFTSNTSTADNMQLFSVDVNGLSGDVVIAYEGTTKAGEVLELSVYNGTTDEWERMAYAKDGVKTSFVVDVDTYVGDGMPEIYVRARVARVDNDSDTFLWHTDTQLYSCFADIASNYTAIMNYAVAEYQAGNIGYVGHTGDITDQSTHAADWDVADTAQKILDQAGVPNGLTVGNHDVGNHALGTSAVDSMKVSGDYTDFWKYFPAARYERTEWYGGSYKNNMHHYDLVTIGDYDFIMMYIGMGQFLNEESVAWINNALQTYSHRNAIILTHEYLSFKIEYYVDTYGGKSAPVGQTIMETFVTPNANVKMVLCGHELGVGQRYTPSLLSGGRKVVEMLGNYQGVDISNSQKATDNFRNENGDGFLRLLKVTDTGIQFDAYSPVLANMAGFEDYADAAYAYDLEHGTMDLDWIAADRELTTVNFSATIVSDTAVDTQADSSGGSISFNTETTLAANSGAYLKVSDLVTGALMYSPIFGQSEYIAPRALNVTISGTPKVRQPLTASYTYDGTEAEFGSTYQWYRLNPTTGLWDAIRGATGLTYTLVSADADKMIRFAVVPASATTIGATVWATAVGPIEKDDSIIIIEGGDPIGETFTVTFNSLGGSAVAAQTVADGGLADKPTDPTRTLYTFGGWYTDADCTIAFSFSTAITANITLYAKWNVKTDLPSTWAQEEVAAAIEHNLIPADLQEDYKNDMNRLNFCRVAVQFLLASTELTADELLASKGVTRPAAYNDCDDDNVLIASALGIVNGVGNNNFAPEREITRAEAARMLALTCAVLDLYNEDAPQTSYADQDEIHSWARAAVNFMYEIKVMTGTTNDRFAPTEPYTTETSIVTFERMYQWMNAQ